MKSFWRDFARNVLGGFRLAAFRRVREEDIRASWTQLVALIALDLVITLASDVATVGPNGQFSSYNLPGVLFYLPLAIIAAWALCALARRPQQVLPLVIAMYALGVAISFVYVLCQGLVFRGFPAWSRSIYVAYYGLHAWLALAIAVAAIRILGMRLAMGVPALLVAALVIGLPLTTIYRGSLWTPRYDGDAYDRYRGLSSEDAFYQQPKLLERELARLKPGRKGVIDLYFVGVAGYASQDVFMKEVNAVDKLFRERFDTGGHSVRLINNAKTVADTPIASVTALKATLSRLAKVMDRNEDILFLFLTSHGSEERLSLDFWPMRFKPLDPKTLRQLLDQAGIKRRVVVVSACYSGGFVEPLKDENTLIITASAPDRNSFGCSNEADFTYFGKAYFDEALRETYSFVGAFEKAKPVIAEREKKQDFKGSEPQIFVGKAIVRPLAQLERQLKAGKRRAGPTAGTK